MCDNIVDIQDNSDEYITRALIIFKNGLELSVIQGRGTYGVNDGLYEIAVYNKQKHYTDFYFEPEDQGDTVLGWCDERKVEFYIAKIGSIS